MTDKTLSSVIGGGGSFVASASYPSEFIAAGATGTFRTLTPPDGKRLRITYMISQSSQTNLLTISVGGDDVVVDVNLEPEALFLSANDWRVSGGVNIITGEIDEVIEFKTNVATSHDIYFMYQEGI